jgi:hypothetical protein
MNNIGIQNDGEEGRVSSPQMPGCTPETMPSKNSNGLKLEVQIADGNKTESQNPNLGDRLGRVCTMHFYTRLACSLVRTMEFICECFE